MTRKQEKFDRNVYEDTLRKNFSQVTKSYEAEKIFTKTAPDLQELF